MANRMPSMLALLGLAAFAGYQNRDKIAGALKDAQERRDSGAPRSGLDDVLAGIGDLIGGQSGAGGNVLTEGLGGILDTFRGAGQRETADSWITPGVPTRGLSPDEVEQAIGRDNLDELSRRTGLTLEELRQRLATAIPETVDRLTPDGHMPADDDEVRRRLF